MPSTGDSPFPVLSTSFSTPFPISFLFFFPLPLPAPLFSHPLSSYSSCPSPFQSSLPFFSSALSILWKEWEGMDMLPVCSVSTMPRCFSFKRVSSRGVARYVLGLMHLSSLDGDTCRFLQRWCCHKSDSLCIRM